MDAESTLHETDARLRAALTPGDVVSQRIVRRALESPPGRTSRRLRYAGALAVLALALGVGAWQWRRPAPTPSASTPGSAPLAVTGRGSMVVVEHADGRRWIVGPPPEPRAGGNYVIVLER
jgi:hypothetical protein